MKAFLTNKSVITGTNNLNHGKCLKKLTRFNDEITFEDMNKTRLDHGWKNIARRMQMNETEMTYCKIIHKVIHLLNENSQRQTRR